MPEGPEVRTVAKTLEQKLVGQEFGSLWHSSFSLRRPVDYGTLLHLENAAIDDVSAYGKVLFISARKKTAMMAQLGMTGQLKVEPVDAPLLPHTHLRWQLKAGGMELRYVDPRRFGLIDACDEQGKQAIIARLGPDPFTLEKDIAPLIATMRRSSRAIKEVLLDQSVIAGVGNIYASEALFQARIHPAHRAHSISIAEYGLLIEAVVDVMGRAFANMGTTFSNYVDGSGLKGNNQAFLQVFQRHALPCKLCQSSIERMNQGGRSTFYCPNCQLKSSTRV